MELLLSVILSLVTAQLNGAPIPRPSSPTSFDIDHAVKAGTAAYAINCGDALYALFATDSDKAFNSDNADRSLYSNTAKESRQCDRAGFADFARVSLDAASPSEMKEEKCAKMSISEEMRMARFLFDMKPEYMIPCGPKSDGGNGKRCKNALEVKRANFAISANHCKYAVFAIKARFAANTRNTTVAHTSKFANYAEISKFAVKAKKADRAEKADFAECSLF